MTSRCKKAHKEEIDAVVKFVDGLTEHRQRRGRSRTGRVVSEVWDVFVDTCSFIVRVIAFFVRRRRVVRALLFRFRTQLAPLWIGLFLYLVRYPVEAYGKWTSVLAVSGLIAFVIVFRLRRKLNRRVEWVYALSCLCAAAAGLTVVAFIGRDNRALNAACIVAYALVTSMWWLHHLGHSPAGVAAKAQLDRFQTLWRTRVGGFEQ